MRVKSVIRVAVMYSNEPQMSFDRDYQVGTHTPLVRERYSPHGLIELEMDEAVNQSDENAAPYVAIAYMTFPGMGEFLAAIEAAGKEVMRDIRNFTDIKPLVHISTKLVF